MTGPVRDHRCTVSYANGFNRWNFPDFTGDGNGFKLGGGKPAPAVNHSVRNSFSFDNAVTGFTDNGNPGKLTLDHNSAYHNGGVGFVVNRSASTLTKNLAIANAKPVTIGSSTGSGNTWDLGDTWNDAALISTDRTTITGPRASDAMIGHSDFLRPRAGTDVGAKI